MVGWKNEKEEIGERKIKRGVRRIKKIFSYFSFLFWGVDYTVFWNRW
jgi:hypothetical protein